MVSNQQAASSSFHRLLSSSLFSAVLSRFHFSVFVVGNDGLGYFSFYFSFHFGSRIQWCSLLKEI